MKSRTLYIRAACIAFPATMCAVAALLFCFARFKKVFQPSITNILIRDVDVIKNCLVTAAIVIIIVAVISVMLLIFMKSQENNAIVFEMNNRAAIALGILEAMGAALCLCAGIIMLVLNVGNTFNWMVNL